MPKHIRQKPNSLEPLWNYEASSPELNILENTFAIPLNNPHFPSSKDLHLREKNQWVFSSEELQDNDTFKKTRNEFNRGMAKVREGEPSYEEMESWFFTKFPGLKKKDYESFCRLFLSRFCIDGFARGIGASLFGKLFQKLKFISLAHSHTPNIRLISHNPHELKFEIVDEYDHTALSFGESTVKNCLLKYDPICRVKVVYEITLNKNEADEYVITRKFTGFSITAYSPLADLIFPNRQLSTYLDEGPSENPLVSNEFIKCANESPSMEFERFQSYYPHAVLNFRNYIEVASHLINLAPNKVEDGVSLPDTPDQFKVKINGFDYAEGFFQHQMPHEKKRLSDFQKEMILRNKLIAAIDDRIKRIEPFHEAMYQNEIQFLNSMKHAIAKNTSESLASARSALLEKYFNPQKNPYYYNELAIAKEELIASLKTPLDQYLSLIRAFDKKMQSATSLRTQLGLKTNAQFAENFMHHYRFTAEAIAHRQLGAKGFNLKDENHCDQIVSIKILSSNKVQVEEKFVFQNFTNNEGEEFAIRRSTDPVATVVVTKTISFVSDRYQETNVQAKWLLHHENAYQLFPPDASQEKQWQDISLESDDPVAMIDLSSSKQSGTKWPEWLNLGLTKKTLPSEEPEVPLKRKKKEKEDVLHMESLAENGELPALATTTSQVEEAPKISWGQWFKGLWEKISNLFSACFSMFHFEKKELSQQDLEIPIQPPTQTNVSIPSVPDNRGSILVAPEEKPLENRVQLPNKPTRKPEKISEQMIDEAISKLKNPDEKTNFNMKIKVETEKAAEEYRHNLDLLGISSVIESVLEQPSFLKEKKKVFYVIVERKENCKKYSDFLGKPLEQHSVVPFSSVSGDRDPSRKPPHIEAKENARNALIEELTNKGLFLEQVAVAPQTVC